MTYYVSSGTLNLAQLLSHRFQVIADFAFDQGEVPVFNSCSGWTPKLKATKFVSEEIRRIPISYGVDILTGRYFVLS